MSAFWESVVDWASDVRIVIGAETSNHAYAYWAQHGYPMNNLDIYPQALRNEYQRALGQLLSRVIRHESEPTERTFRPDYVRSAGEYRALAYDVSTTTTSVVGIATIERNWAEPTRRIDCVPAPPSHLDLCMTPGESMAAEQLRRVINFFRSRKLFIVGGRADPRVVRAIEEATGLGSERIEWLPAEKSKPPRNLRERWAHLDPDRDFTVCVTGRIGHAQSEAAAAAAKKRGVRHVKVEQANGIVGALVVSALDQCG